MTTTTQQHDAAWYLARIDANVEAYYTGAMRYDAFSAEQRRLWADAERDGVERDVSAALRDRL